MRFINLKESFLLLSFLFVFIFSNAQDLTDAAIKKNVAAIDSPLQKLTQLSPVSYEYDHANYKHLKFQKGRQYGFIAEEMQHIFPHLVKQKAVSYMFGKNVYRDTRIRIVNEAGLVPVLVASIKEQQSEIEKLKADVQELKNKLANLKN